MKIHFLKSAIACLLVLALGACAEEDTGGDSTVSAGSTSATSTISDNGVVVTGGNTTGTNTTVVAGDNPIVRSVETFGQNGNLYKPVSDETALGAGNVVVLFGSSFTRQFESCSMMLNDGTRRNLRCIDDQPFTQIPFSCFSNGNRQTWRADFRCGSVGSVEVICMDRNQEITFRAPTGQEGNICSRFG